MSHYDRDVAVTMERLYPPVIGGKGWDDVLHRLDQENATACTAARASRRGLGRSDRRRTLARRARAGRSVRSLLVAGLIGAAVAATPALALSTTVRHLIGLGKPPRSAPLGWTRPRLVAKVTGLTFPKQEPFGLPMVTVRFTVGEVGKPPGTGVTFGSYFLVHLVGRTSASNGQYFVRAQGSEGHYVATAPRPRGGIGSIEIAGWINVQKGPSAANGTFWIPVTVTVQNY